VVLVSLSAAVAGGHSAAFGCRQSAPLPLRFGTGPGSGRGTDVARFGHCHSKLATYYSLLYLLIMAKPVVLITGASQGIGAEIAKVFAKEIKGVRLALVARNEKNLAKVAKGCAKRGATVETFLCDVTDEASVAEMAGAVITRFKAVDVLINNAGKFQPTDFLTMSVADFDGLINANLRSLFLVSRALVPAMAERGSGDVFNMSSIAGQQAYPGGAGYCAAKFGVTGLSKVMREELKSKGVRVTTVYPGATVSPSWEGSGFDTDKMMPTADVARAFYEIYRMSRKTVVEEIVLRPQGGDF
jgi:NADP-dependent 3-hydroxy acid dehydrogenase YdfG